MWFLQYLFRKLFQFFWAFRDVCQHLFESLFYQGTIFCFKEEIGCTIFLMISKTYLILLQVMLQLSQVNFTI